MDVMGSERIKTIIRLVVYLFRKKLGKCAEVQAVHNDMINCANPVFQLLTQIINEASNNITDEEYQQRTVKELGELALWLLYKDTGYRDILFWIMKQVCNNKEAFEKALENYYQEPEQWYVNVWSKTKKNSKKMRKKKQIPKYEVSPDEEIFVPQRQIKKLNKY